MIKDILMQIQNKMPRYKLTVDSNGDVLIQKGRFIFNSYVKVYRVVDFVKKNNDPQQAAIYLLDTIVNKKSHIVEFDENPLLHA